MLRFMAPYLVVASVAAMAAGAAYGEGWIDVPILYAIAFAATMLAGAGYARWDERQHPPRR
jgi:hypothetical protein